MQPGSIQTWDQPVENAEGEEAVPAQRADVDVGDRPVSEVRQGVDTLDRQHRTFECRHSVGRHRDDHELQNCVIAHPVPRAAQGQKALSIRPGRRNQHQGEHHAERLRPVGQG